MKISIDDIDLGMKKIMAAGLKSKSLTASAGVIGDKAKQKHKLSSESVGAIAVHNEYGTDNAPARPFVRSTYDEQEEAVEKQLLDISEKLLSGKTPSSSDIVKPAKSLSNKIKEKIRTNDFAALAPRTIAARVRRGNTSTQPLYDTHQLHDAVTAEAGDGDGK